MSGRFVRLGERDRPVVSLLVDGAQIEALQGDTLMVALLTRKATLRQSEFDSGRRAGFCLMGACQDCWVWTRSGERCVPAPTKFAMDSTSSPPSRRRNGHFFTVRRS